MRSSYQLSRTRASDPSAPDEDCFQTTVNMHFVRLLVSLLAAVVVSMSPTALESWSAYATVASKSPTPARVIRVGPSHDVRTLRKAAEIARDGDVVEVEAGDYHRDTAVWTQKNLVIRGAGARARLIADGAEMAEGKAIFVIRGDNVTIENLAFVGARVPDRNGAGVRHERGRLTVTNCLFEDNENGILTSNDANSELHIADSTFLNNGAGDGYSHNLYAGTIAALSVTASYFGPARKGHLLKGRAKATSVTYSRLTGESGSSSYEIDVSNGGVFKAIGNLIQQGSATENSVIVSYGAEGYRWPANHAHIAFNTLINDRSQSGIFVAIRSGPAEAVISNNILVGSGELQVKTQAEVKGNVQARTQDFVDPAQFDYRLRVGSRFDGAAGAVGTVGSEKAPTREYRHTAGSVELSGLTALTPLSPGAFQRLAR